MPGFSCATIILLSTLAADIAPPPLRVVSAQAAPEWDTLFAGRTGWIGADGVFSQPLRDDRVLWLFGDTLYGRVDGRRRVDAVMVNNSIAITGRSPQTAGSFPVFRTAANTPRSALVPPDGPGWFWPLSVSLVGDRLAIFLTRVDKSNDPGVFGFQLIGQSLALVTNPESPPTEWKIDWIALPNTLFTAERQRSWGAALLPMGDWLYIYGVDERIPADPAQRQIDRKQMLLARCAPSSFARVETWQYFSEAGWSDDPAAAKPLLRGLASEYSVTRLPESKTILLVHTDCGLSPKILARTATAPEGSWSEPSLLFTKPEVVADKGLFGYNGKAHAWACRAVGPGRGTLLVNYAVNAWEFRRLFDDETVYRPRFVTIEYEQPEALR
jgi:hypothetical protein